MYASEFVTDCQKANGIVIYSYLQHLLYEDKFYCPSEFQRLVRLMKEILKFETRYTTDNITIVLIKQIELYSILSWHV